MSSNDVRDVIAAWKNEQIKGTCLSESSVGVSSQFPFFVASFVKKWGKDAAIGIVKQAFSMPHNGNFNGRWLGEELFSSSMSTYHSQLYQEWIAGQSDAIKGNFI